MDHLITAALSEQHRASLLADAHWHRVARASQSTGRRVRNPLRRRRRPLD